MGDEDFTIDADVVLCDIEGTTTSISFVRELLFDYAKDNCLKFLHNNWTQNQVAVAVFDLSLLPEFQEYKKDQNIDIDDTACPVALIAKFVRHLTEEESKVTPLKYLHGYIWAEGYNSKTLIGHVYDDVPEAFKRWRRNGIKICTYSSGSILSQQLLFKNSKCGDLTSYISRYFDTTIGRKDNLVSYINIAQTLGVRKERILFLTDLVTEAEAAKNAGLQVIVMERPGNYPVYGRQRTEYRLSRDFTNIIVDNK